jgi:hypothetical protein
VSGDRFVLSVREAVRLLARHESSSTGGYLYIMGKFSLLPSDVMPLVACVTAGTVPASCFCENRQR